MVPGGTLLCDLDVMVPSVGATRLQEDLRELIDLLDFQTHLVDALANELEEQYL